MANKRRRPSADPSNPTNKRTKFTLVSDALPKSVTKGVVLVTGGGDFGQLGLGPDILEKSRPAMVKMDHEIVDICAGGMHTVCLTKDGKVITFGCNDEGALGRIITNQEDGEFMPDVVELPSKAVQISAGDSHTVALLDDGRVFVWGTFRDSHGNMGLTVNGNEKLPIELMKDHHVMKVASGADHVVLLTKFGEIFTCGCAEQGQLGRTTARSGGRNGRNGFGSSQLSKLLTPAPIYLKPSAKLHFENVWAGNYCTFAKVFEKDEIYVFGLNNYYQMGLGLTEPYYMPKKSSEFSKYKWESISCAQHHTIALAKDGKVYAIGRKEYGRLGLGDVTEDATTLTEIPFFAGKKAVSIGCGSSTSFAVLDNGDLYGWGMGTVGQLGTGDEDDKLKPVLIKGKQMLDKRVFKVQSGGQHTVILAEIVAANNEQGDSNAQQKSTSSKETLSNGK